MWSVMIAPRGYISSGFRFRHDWRRQGSSGVPFHFEQTNPDCHHRNIETFAPFRDSEHLSIVRESHIVAPITTLSLSVRPSHVGRSVVAIIVDSVKTHAGWFWSQNL